MTNRTRRWKGRAFGILAAAAVAAAGIVAAGAAPAHALIRPDVSDCWDPVEIYCYDDGGDPGGGGGGSGQINERAMVAGGIAYEMVENALDTNDPCRALVHGGTASQALAVFHAVPITSSQTIKPGQPGVAAEAPSGAGAAGYIKVYPRYYNTEPDMIFNYLPANTGLSRRPSTDEYKAMALLHENAHLNGKLGAHTGQQSGEFNRRILQDCLGISSYPIS